MDYVATVDYGSFFVGLGVLVLLLVFSYIFYKLYRPLLKTLETISDRSTKYELIEEVFLDRLAEKKGIDLNKKMLEKEFYKHKPKKIRQKLEEEVYNSMFNKEIED